MEAKYRGLVGAASDGTYQWSVVNTEGHVLRTGTAASAEAAADAVERVFETIEEIAAKGLPSLQS